MKRLFTAFTLTLTLTAVVPAAEKMRALIVDGQNNHQVWPRTTMMLKKYLEQTELFDVDVARTKFIWGNQTLAKKYPINDGKTYIPTRGQKADPDFRPDFSKYRLVVSNYNGGAWPKETQKAFEGFVKSGGGFVVIHAANNAFSGWKEYDQMIGLGWRGAGYGNRLELNEKGTVVRSPKGSGPGAGHGRQHPFAVVVRNHEHPITKGLPKAWLHARDELYHGQRGPAANMTILTTAFSAKNTGGTGTHEPMMWVIPYGKGRVFTNVMGHGDYSQECVGFIATFKRGAEWAATGKVTQTLPDDFPTIDAVRQRKFGD